MAFGDFTVTRASTKNVLGSAGLYVSVANNVPAFEFNTDGSYRGLLVEPGATNLLQRNRDLSNEYYSTIGIASITTTTDFTVGACSIVTESASDSRHYVRRANDVFGNDANRSISAWVKNVSGTRYVYLSTSSDTTNNPFGGVNGRIAAAFDLQTISVTQLGSGCVATIDNMGNGWFRIWAFNASVSDGESNSERWSLGFSPMGTGLNNTTLSYTGTGKSMLVVFGGAVIGAFSASSPIPTDNSTVTRIADVVSLTGASSLIGQSEGTIYAEVVPRNYTAGVNRRILNIRVDGNNVISLEAETTIRRYSFSVTNGGVQQVGIISGDIMTDTIKLSGAYKVDDFAFYINGSQIGTDTSGTVPNVTTGTIGLGISGDGVAGTEFNGHIRAVALFPTRLDNATLATLTTL